MAWTPTPFNLLDGNPFKYSEDGISLISEKEVFNTEIDPWDGGRCAVCGLHLCLRYCHIIPKGEHIIWQQMKEHGFVPESAKGVGHDDESRNGILMCPNHQYTFERFYHYIRWVPDQSLFVFINHSQTPSLEEYHGRAINIDVNRDRVPFQGAFLLHEARVRAHWALNDDRAIRLPIPHIPWINSGGCGNCHVGFG